MKRRVRSGLPVAATLAALAIAGVALISYGSYRYVFTRLNRGLDDRLLRAAQEGARIAGQMGAGPAGERWTGEEGRVLHEKLASIRRSSHLENLFLFDPDLRSLADARARIRPGKQYTLMSLSVDAVREVLAGRTHVDHRLDVAGLPFRSAAVPLLVDGRVAGGVYAQANIDFEKELAQLQQRWLLAVVLSFAVSVLLAVGVIGTYQYTNRIRDALNKRSRLELIHLLSAGIAHDIKNPLQTVSAAGELLETRFGSSPEARELADYIREGTRRILEIVGSALGGAGLREPRAIELREFIGSLLKQLRPVALEKRVALGADIGEAVRVRAAPAALRMAVANVLKNALEAVAPEQGRVRVDCRRKGRRVGIAVSDNGPGIPPALRRRIFEPLVTTKDEGSGLGLAVTRQILEDMRGSLDLESEPGKGSTFILWVAEAGGGDDQSAAG